MLALALSASADDLAAAMEEDESTVDNYVAPGKKKTNISKFKFNVFA